MEGGTNYYDPEWIHPDRSTKLPVDYLCLNDRKILNLDSDPNDILFL